MSNNQLQRHKILEDEQDEQLDEVKNIAERLKFHAEDINVELEDQNKMFKQANTEMDKTQEKMG